MIDRVQERLFLAHCYLDEGQGRLAVTGQSAAAVGLAALHTLSLYNLSRGMVSLARLIWHHNAREWQTCREIFQQCGRDFLLTISAVALIAFSLIAPRSIYPSSSPQWVYHFPVPQQIAHSLFTGQVNELTAREAKLLSLYLFQKSGQNHCLFADPGGRLRKEFQRHSISCGHYRNPFAYADPESYSIIQRGAIQTVPKTHQGKTYLEMLGRLFETKDALEKSYFGGTSVAQFLKLHQLESVYLASGWWDPSKPASVTPFDTQNCKPVTAFFSPPPSFEAWCDLLPPPPDSAIDQQPQEESSEQDEVLQGCLEKDFTDALNDSERRNKRPLLIEISASLLDALSTLLDKGKSNERTWDKDGLDRQLQADQDRLSERFKTNYAALLKAVEDSQGLNRSHQIAFIKALGQQGSFGGAFHILHHLNRQIYETTVNDGADFGINAVHRVCLLKAEHREDGRVQLHFGGIYELYYTSASSGKRQLGELWTHLIYDLLPTGEVRAWLLITSAKNLHHRLAISQIAPVPPKEARAPEPPQNLSQNQGTHLNLGEDLHAS